MDAHDNASVIARTKDDIRILLTVYGINNKYDTLNDTITLRSKLTSMYKTATTDEQHGLDKLWTLATRLSNLYYNATIWEGIPSA